VAHFGHRTRLPIVSAAIVSEAAQEGQLTVGMNQDDRGSLDGCQMESAAPPSPLDPLQSIAEVLILQAAQLGC
jgi:hypothetical protein